MVHVARHNRPSIAADEGMPVKGGAKAAGDLGQHPVRELERRDQGAIHTVRKPRRSGKRSARPYSGNHAHNSDRIATRVQPRPPPKSATLPEKLFTQCIGPGSLTR